MIDFTVYYCKVVERDENGVSTVKVCPRFNECDLAEVKDGGGGCCRVYEKPSFTFPPSDLSGKGKRYSAASVSIAMIPPVVKFSMS